MKFTIKGNLCGYLCTDCDEPLSGMEVLLYRPLQNERILESTVTNAKETFHLVSKEEAMTRKELLIATSISDDKGNFEFEVSENYANTAFDIDFICGSVPRGPVKPTRKEPVQFHITTFYPLWRTEQDRERSYFHWQYCISSYWWCYIRGYYFDAWVICGNLTNCETGVPIANATVTAWDADFITEDNLGTVLTDANGHFRIDYTSIQFKQTFLSPWFNVETDTGGIFPQFNSGPDVYFKASIGGVTLIDETKANRRNNVSYCLCVNLCTKINVGDMSAWTSIGSAFNVPNDFDIDGYAGAGKYALNGVIQLEGQGSPKTASGHNIEYRFLVSDTAIGGASPALTFTKIVGVTPGLFVAGTVAKLMEKVSPMNVHDVESHQDDFDGAGWFDVNKAIARTVLSRPGTNLNDYWFIDEDSLIAMNTGVLTTVSDVDPDIASAGEVFPVGSKFALEKVAIRFEIRDAVTGFPIPGTGKTLNSAVINNDPIFMKLAVQELEISSCSPISGIIHAKYTVYHPHLQYASINVRNNSNSINKNLIDGFITLSNNINATVNAGNNNSLQINASPNDLVRCTYAITLTVRRRLHNGDSQVPFESLPSLLFFYEI